MLAETRAFGDSRAAPAMQRAQMPIRGAGCETMHTNMCLARCRRNSDRGRLWVAPAPPGWGGSVTPRKHHRMMPHMHRRGGRREG